MYKKIFMGGTLTMLILAGAGCMDTQSPGPTSTNQYVTSTGQTAVGPNNGSDFLATTSIATNGVTGSIQPSGSSRPATTGGQPVASANDPATKAYIAALAIYNKSGYRYQFQNCSGLPGTFTIKKNVKFMLDNRDSERHILGINNVKYAVPAYSYVVASVSKAGDYFVTCDGGGAAQIKVQN